MSALMDAILATRKARMVVRAATLATRGGSGSARGVQTGNVVVGLGAVQSRVLSLAQAKADQVAARNKPPREALAARRKSEAEARQLQQGLTEVFNLQTALADLSGGLL